ncbi:MAG: hypothetical protein OH316_00280 [Candidatus Parvarchaeota archaeon]|nr:hypothetical protein [Candidatus Parvarchaeota archaeon]MCW1301564.1 hypothetical protein [Candidatus Parvarchaeota archaeon]
MENWYKFFKEQSNRTIKVGEYEIVYKGKNLEESWSSAEKPPVSVHKESIKVLKNGEKVKLKKADKLKLIEALKRGNLDEVSGLLPK